MTWERAVSVGGLRFATQRHILDGTWRRLWLELHDAFEPLRGKSRTPVAWPLERAIRVSSKDEFVPLDLTDSRV
jgi:hypothetical protein